MEDVAGTGTITRRDSNIRVDDMISHLDEMFEDDGKNHDEFFEKFDKWDENGTAEATPEQEVEEEGPEQEWFNQLEDMDIEIMDDNSSLQMRQLTDSIARKIVQETAGKLRKLKTELYSKIKTKGLEKANEKRETFIAKKQELKEKYKQKMNQLQVYRGTAPYFQLKDKLSFVLGVFICGTFAYIMGRWPNDFFYQFYLVFVPLMCFIRFVHYKPKGWHYYLIDFCYYAGAIVLLFIGIYPKSPVMYRLAFMYANGSLATATAAFSNALIFHKFDNLISLVTHPVPLLCMWNVKYITMFEQKDLPEDKRYFLNHPFEENFFSWEAFYLNFVIPYLVYFVWAVIYYQINFRFKTKKIEEKEYKTLFKYFSQNVPWSKKLIEEVGPKKSPMLFMGYHCVYFSISHFFAVISFYSTLIHTFLMLMWLTIGVWNGSCFYVKFFEYTKQLAYQQKYNIQLMNEAMNMKKEEQEATAETSDSSSKKNN